MEESAAQVLDLTALAARAAADGVSGPAWSLSSADLNLNLLRFSAGDGVAAHVNAEVDVIGVVVAGEGVLVLDDREEPLYTGALFFIPKGARRALRAVGGDLAYLSAHRRRAGLMPTPRGTHTAP
ncbi:MAG TPA: cupin domain-containing protein [Ktedonobacterales bacterium]|nr:cupin domain-containing protein [Ktedonobacterales bacterium]